MIDIKKIQPQIKKLAEKHRLSMVLLFGSQAAKEIHKQSDIDIAYFSEESLDISHESRMVIDLADIFKTDSIDLVSLRNSPPLLLKEISENSVVLYQSNPSLFNEFRIYAFKKYLDNKVLLDLRSDYLRHKVKKYQKELKYVQ